MDEGRLLPMPMLDVLSRGTELELRCMFSGCLFMRGVLPRGTELPPLCEDVLVKGLRLASVGLVVCLTSQICTCL